MPTKPVCTVVYHYHNDMGMFTALAFEFGTGNEIAFIKGKHLPSVMTAIGLSCVPMVTFMDDSPRGST